MKLTVVVAICLVLCLNYELSSSHPLRRTKTKSIPANYDKVEARQSYADDDYYDEEEDEEEEEELQQLLNDQNGTGTAGGQGEGAGGQEPEEEDDNEEDEGDEEEEEADGEERFMEDKGIFTRVFNIF